MKNYSHKFTNFWLFFASKNMLSSDAETFKKMSFSDRFWITMENISENLLESIPLMWKLIQLFVIISLIVLCFWAVIDMVKYIYNMYIYIFLENLY